MTVVRTKIATVFCIITAPFIDGITRAGELRAGSTLSSPKVNIRAFTDHKADCLFDNQKHKAIELFWDKGLKAVPHANPG